MREWAAMANYFRWKKGKRDEDVFYSEKPRSRSLDPRSLELSGIRLVAHCQQQQQLEQQASHSQQSQQVPLKNVSVVENKTNIKYFSSKLFVLHVYMFLKHNTSSRCSYY